MFRYNDVADKDQKPRLVYWLQNQGGSLAGLNHKLQLTQAIPAIVS